MDAVAKYLRARAEPEIAIAAALPASWARALVVPACREEPSLLDGYVAAAHAASGRTLCILVVNGPDDAPSEEHAESGAFLASVIEGLAGARPVRGAPGAVLGSVSGAPLDVLVIDRASPGARLPRKAGVGLARKIGFDVALALHVAGHVEAPLLYGTDADATLPDDFFADDAARTPGRAAAVVFPFWHDAGEDSAVTAATAFYEVSLRYYVAGLAWAGSPYAFHTLGSATAVFADAYAAVRGVPKRQAAEDFYLLNKLAKVSAVKEATTGAVKLRSRTSDRTPFGTGASVRAALAGAARTLYAPECFAAVRDVVAALRAFAEDADVQRALAVVDCLPRVAQGSASRLLDEWGARAALDGAAREAPSIAARRAHVDGWFDGFRTLKWIHAVEDAGFPKIPWDEALARAPFCSALTPDERRADALADPALVALRVALSCTAKKIG